MDDQQQAEKNIKIVVQEHAAAWLKKATEQTQISRSASVGAIAGALARAQGKFETVLKERKMQMNPRRGGEVKYLFANLADAIRTVRVPLSMEEIVYVQAMMAGPGGRNFMNTLLAHSSGEWIETRMPLDFVPGGMSDDEGSGRMNPQKAGSLVTYGRRIALLAALGIAVDDHEDNDGGSDFVRDDDRAPAAKGDSSQKGGGWDDEPAPKAAAKSADDAWGEPTSHGDHPSDAPRCPSDVDPKHWSSMLVSIAESNTPGVLGAHMASMKTAVSEGSYKILREVGADRLAVLKKRDND